MFDGYKDYSHRFTDDEVKNSLGHYGTMTREELEERVKIHPDGKPWDDCCSCDPRMPGVKCAFRKDQDGGARLNAKKAKGVGRFFCVHRTDGGYHRVCGGYAALDKAGKLD